MAGRHAELERILDRYFERFDRDDPPAPSDADLSAWLGAALDLAAQAGGRRSAFDRVAREVGGEDLRDWLDALPAALAAAGRAGDALRLADAFAPLLAPYAAEHRPAALAALGRTEEALAAAGAAAAAFPGNPHVLTAAAEAFGRAGRDEHAASLFDAALDAAAEDPGLTLDVLDVYQPWAEARRGFFRRLRLRRRREDAEERLRAEDEDADGGEDRFESDDDPAGLGDDEGPFDDDGEPVDPALIPDPIVVPDRPGRNAPCPCGSGRKFKKCCGT